MSKHQIVVSAENNAYCAWQCKLFYFSCVTRTPYQPIVIVHGAEQGWHPGFDDLNKTGCGLYPAPNYRKSGKGDDYFPRNTPGTLIHAAQICTGESQFIVLCDPDMIFTAEPQFSEALSADFCWYMACGQVPYVIPTSRAAEIGTAWLEAVDSFSVRIWIDSMHAFGMAAAKLGLGINTTHITDSNCWPDRELSAGSTMLHYCYDDHRWSKRNYIQDCQTGAVWTPKIEEPPGTVLGELLTQIREAGEFYGKVHLSLRA